MNRSCFLSLAACRTPLNPWDTRASRSVWEGLRPAKFHEKDRQRGGRMGTAGSGEADDTVDR